jgi:hypothetical protein
MKIKKTNKFKEDNKDTQNRKIIEFKKEYGIKLCR